MTPQEDFDRQHGHAEQIREMREQQRGHGDDGAKMADMEKALATLKADNEALKARLEFLESQEICGPGHSGTFKDGPSYDPTSTGAIPSGLPGSGGQWFAEELCDGTTLEAWVRNVVPPP